MGNIETFVEKLNIPKRNYQGFIVHSDGEWELGRFYNCAASKTGQRDMLTEVHGGREVTVLNEVTKTDLDVRSALRETMSDEVNAFLHGDLAAPTLDARCCLSRISYFGRLLRGTDEYLINQPYGLPQAHNSALLPPATGVTPTAGAATGSVFSAGTYYVWVVPVSRCRTLGYAVSDTDWATANLPNLVRGLHWTPWTKSASGTVTLGSGSQINVAFTAPTIAEDGVEPDAFFIVVGSANDITDSASCVHAIYNSFTSGDAVNCSVEKLTGSPQFGTNPAISDLLHVDVGTVVSDARVWTPATSGTDFEWGANYESLARIDGGAIADGAPVRITNWFRRAYAADIFHGQSRLSNKYIHLRLVNWQVDGTDPDTRYARGLVVDFPRVNIAGMEGDLLSANPDGFHNPIEFRAVAEYSSLYGYSARLRSIGLQHRNTVDYWSNDITPAAA